MGADPVRTPGQNRQIWGLLRDLGARSGLGRDELEELLRSACLDASGQESSARLTVRQAAQVIGRLSSEVGRYDTPAPAPAAPAPARLPIPDRPESRPHEPWGPRGRIPRENATITPAQQWTISVLFRQIGWSDVGRQRGFCLRQVKKPWPQTQQEADALIEPLSEMAVRAITIEEIRERIAALQSVRLDAWKTGFVADVARQAEFTNKGWLTPHKLAKILECERAAEAAAGKGRSTQGEMARGA